MSPGLAKWLRCRPLGFGTLEFGFLDGAALVSVQRCDLEGDTLTPLASLSGLFRCAVLVRDVCFSVLVRSESQHSSSKPLPPWKRPERWLAFVLTFFGVCSFLAIVPVNRDAAALDEVAAAVSLSSDDISFMDYLRAGAREVQVVGHWTSLLPPLIAVLVAAFFRTMVGALVSAFTVGSFLSYGLNPLATGVLGVNDFLVQPVLSQFSIFIILFLLALVGMAHVMARSGGLSGLVDVVSRVAKTRDRAKVSVGLGGLLIFFDDYSNTMVLGTTMRRLADRWRISREKLAYLVDSTAAPVAGLALLSTWVAFEVQLLGDTSTSLGVGVSGYGLLVDMLPLRFYCIGALVFVFFSSALGRDFGPMLKAEQRAFDEGSQPKEGSGIQCIQSLDTMEEDSDSPRRWYNALVPIGAVMASTVVGILVLGASRLRASGEGFSFLSFADWRSAFGLAVYDPKTESDVGVVAVLLVAAIVGGILAVAMPVAQGVLRLKPALGSYAKGLPAMWMTIFILAMAWSMQEVCANLGTAQYLVAMLGGGMPLWLLPLLTFLVAAGMSFATGTSWGTMGILIPILLPLAAELGALEPDNFAIYLLTAAAILDGAIFGDHCSPISDTTVLSSASTGCDHIAHVGTQLSYALVAMVLSCVFGYLSVARGLPLWSFYILYPFVVYLFLLTFGKRLRST